MTIKSAHRTRKGFRLPSSTIKQLAQLVERTHNTQTKILERAIEALHAQIVKGTR